MSGAPLAFRQIHLDFHTSEHIAGIGAGFDPDVFADTLADAAVNSITCFAKCHHGWLYYDSKAMPDKRHPHLKLDLLRAQIEACHARGIRVPIYITVEWDYQTANEHPEWLAVTEEGHIAGTPPYEAGFYRQLCLNTPYVDVVKKVVKEVLSTLPTDGLFFDIVLPLDCSCKWCRAGMESLGLEPSDKTVRMNYGAGVVNTFKKDMTAFIRAMNTDCTIFYNAGHLGPRDRSVAGAYTHFEVESLPSGGWGYMHFPVTSRYARTLLPEVMGMTGKFHTSWGDFHSFKNPAALEFECFHMAALGAKCSIGDQLHPNGAICPHTYELVGSVYRQIRGKEPWLADAEPVVEIAVMTPEEFAPVSTFGALPKPLLGAARMLQEGHRQFSIIDSKADLAQYKAVILPDGIPVDAALASALEAYVANGGSIIASHKSGLTPDGGAFALESFGVRYVGDAPWSPDFLVPDAHLDTGLAPAEYVMYQRAIEITSAPGTEILAQTNRPYFNRTYKHFCSHRHTPSSGEPCYPAVTRRGQVIYFAHPIFNMYQTNAPAWVKRLLLNALALLLPEPLVSTGAPSSAIVTINDQPELKRWVLHFLHYVPERRGEEFDVIEDIVPLFDIPVSIRVPGVVRRVECAPQGHGLDFTGEEGRILFTVPEVRGHQMVAIEFAELDEGRGRPKAPLPDFASVR